MEQTKNGINKKEYKFIPKPEFEERMNSILKLGGSDEKSIEEDIKAFWKIVHTEPINSIRCNTLKISPQELKEKLEKNNGWNIIQPYKEKGYPEIMIIQNPLMPGELGKAKEHMLGYFYVQEISSMLPLIALKLTKSDSFLDLCASPGSKTTQAAMYMKNKGNIIANDNKMSRMAILASNLEKCGVSNTIVTKRDGVQLCKSLKRINFNLNKILVDAPCTGEGTLRSSPKTFIMWNIKSVQNLSLMQKALASSALDLLSEGGEMIYSTCTHAPEENEEVVQYLLDNFDIKIEKIDLPIKIRSGLSEWNGKKFDKQIENCARIYPQDNNTEGFFIAKIKKLGEN